MTGFAIHPSVLRDDECDALLAALAAPGVTRSRAGARHLMSHPGVAQLANDARLLDIATAMLARPALPFRATLFDKSTEGNWSVQWHQDTALPLRRRVDLAGWGPWSTKSGVLYAHAPTAALERVIALRVHLDASTATNGPLRVLPGSHLLGVLSDDEVSDYAHRHEGVDCLVPRGGVLMMRPLLIHSSTRIEVPAPRRVLHIEYADSLTLGDGIELARA